MLGQLDELASRMNAKKKFMIAMLHVLGVHVLVIRTTGQAERMLAEQLDRL